jgi:hypothetical protein
MERASAGGESAFFGAGMNEDKRPRNHVSQLFGGLSSRLEGMKRRMPPEALKEALLPKGPRWLPLRIGVWQADAVKIRLDTLLSMGEQGKERLRRSGFDPQCVCFRLDGRVIVTTRIDVPVWDDRGVTPRLFEYNVSHEAFLAVHRELMAEEDRARAKGVRLGEASLFLSPSYEKMPDGSVCVISDQPAGIESARRYGMTPMGWLEPVPGWHPYLIPGRKWDELRSEASARLPRAVRDLKAPHDPQRQAAIADQRVVAVVTSGELAARAVLCSVKLYDDELAIHGLMPTGLRQGGKFLYAIIPTDSLLARSDDSPPESKGSGGGGMMKPQA